MAERILILDDEPDFLSFARAALIDAGHVLETLSEPLKIPTVMEEFMPSVLVLDIIMPGLDGIEIITWLANTGFSGRVILISGFNPQYIDIAEKFASGRGLASIITLRKPISPQELRAAVAGE